MVLCGGPWSFGKSTLTIKKWEPNMDLSNALFLTTPIQVRLPSLPPKFWHEDIFKGIVGSFGELIVVDHTKSKLQSARLYVKVANLNNLPEKVELISKLGKRIQEIIYEDLPNTYFSYKMKGHRVKNCPKKSKNYPKIDKEDKKKEEKTQKKVWKPKVTLEKGLKNNLNLKNQETGMMPNSVVRFCLI